MAKPNLEQLTSQIQYPKLNFCFELLSIGLFCWSHKAQSSSQPLLTDITTFMVMKIASDGEEYDRYGIHFQSYKFKILIFEHDGVAGFK